jgi:hypothetical protein
MANPGLTTHLPIIPVKTISGNQEFFLYNAMEASGMTFVQGTPVQKATSGGKSGYWINSTPSNGSTQVIIGGISYLAGNNFATNGAGVSPPFGSIGFPGGPTYGSVQNQSAAVNVLHGAPFLNGLITGGQANLDTIWEIQVDASSGGTYNATNTLVGSTIGLNIDSSGFWYADLANINNSSYADANVVGLNPLDYVAGSTTTQQNYGRIWFVLTTKVIQPTP